MVHQLTEKELNSYRQWLEELDEEAQEPGGNPQTCDKEVWEYFNPCGDIGAQIYNSFSDNELLEFLLKHMDKPGHKVPFKNIYCIHKQYLRRRFGDLRCAANLATKRRKQIIDEERWPWDWPERVSPHPLLEMLDQRHRTILPEDLIMIERICREAKQTGLPPKLSVGERERLDKLYNSKMALELMGIPALKDSALLHMKCYWAEQKRRMKETEEEF